MKTTSIISLLVASTNAWANNSVPPFDNLPQMNAPKNIGRVVAFEGFRKSIWFTPTAFSSRLDCYGETTSTSFCKLQVFNDLNSAEIAALGDLKQSGQQIIPMSDVDVGVTSRITGGFANLNTDFATAPIVMNTLAMSNSFPYASGFTRRGTGVGAKQAYETGGLGVFESQFQVNGQWSGDYLAITDGSRVLNALNAITQKTIKLSRLKSILAEAVSESELISQNLSDSEARKFAVILLVDRIARPLGNGNLEIKRELLQSLKGYSVLHEELENRTMICKTTLVLKKDAEAVTQCSEKSDASEAK